MDIERDFCQLTPDQQLRLATEVMNDRNRNGWPLVKKFKNPERLLRYYKKIKIPIKNIVFHHNINLEVLENDQPNLAF